MTRRAPRRELSLLAVAAAAGLSASAAVADDRVCDYDITVLDRAAAKVEIKVACDPVLKVQKFTALGDRRHWSTDAATYRDGQGDFEYNLGAFAAEEDDMGSAMSYGGGVLVTPAFLLPLPETDAAAMLRFRVTFADGGVIHTAMQPDADDRYTVPLLRIDEVGPLLLGEVTAVSLMDDPELTLALPTGMALTPEVMTAWVDAVAHSNRRFWGRSPAQHGLVVLVPSPRGGVPFGRVLSLGGSVVTVLVGKSATARDLYDDWVLVHEFLHLGSPMMRDKGPWLNEGIATFYEPVLRARAGWKSEDDVWREWISQMPRGLPAMTDAGLSNAGRGGIYWGGAVFVLMAEMELLQASGGKYGFSDCLRHILADGGDATTKWPTARLLQSCDKATGQELLSQLTQRHMAKGSVMSLDEIWQKLGVTLSEDGKITYDDSAELAWLRPLIIWGGAERPAPISATGFFSGG